jgi:tetratricopeptide (TPR) repeat protein
MKKSKLKSILIEPEAIDLELSEIKELLNLDKELAYNKIKELIIICESINYEKGIGFCYNLFGIYYHHKDLNEKALQYYFKADRILSKSLDWQDRILSKTNIGIIYTKTEQYDKCLQIYKAVEKEIEQQPESMLHAQLYVNLDAALIKIGDLINGYNYIKKAVSIVEKFNNPFGMALCYGNLSSYLIQQNDFKSAEKYLEKALEICKANNFIQLLCSTYLNIIKLELGRKNLVDAINFSDICLDHINKHYNDDLILQEVLKLRMEIYEGLLNFEAAYHEAKEYIIVRDRFNSTEKSRKINELQIQFETEKKEIELKELKITQQKNQIEKVESELKAIKAQMNPHFIFNALNSIQELFILGDKRLANEQLGNFSILTRKILEVSGKKSISLLEEIDILTKYLSLESIRFEKDFEFHFILSEGIEEDFIEIPPMLIQPIIENAIKHGILHKEGKKRITIDFKEDNSLELLICTISDNGIGRAKSAEINLNRPKSHVSFATIAIQKRLDLLNQNRQNPISLLFEDLKDMNGNALGTKAILQIPLIK